LTLFSGGQKSGKGKGKGDEKKPKPPGGAAARLERELPYVVTLITIMAASGISPFGSFVKLARYKLLPNIMVEARKIVNQVHILGDDPLTAMEKRAESTGSRQYRDLLLGYVSTVRNGGDIASFLQNKMQSIFEYEVAIARQAIAKVGGLVDAYMIMQVIGLSLYVVVVALSSLPSSDLMPQTLSSPVASYLIVFVILPAISIAILYALDKTATISSSLVGARRVLYRGVAFSAAAMAAFAILAFMGAFKPFIAPAYAFPLFLAAASAWPAYRSIKMERGMRGVESEMPSYLRDIAESRKAGLSPEKCIIYASERHRDARFQSIAKAFSNQLEWGVPLRKIYENLARTVRSRSALVHFRILIEAIESGGGYTASLDILAKSSESSQGAEKEKASMLKPYFMIAFMVTALTSVTTLMVAQTFMDVGGSILPGSQPAPQTMGKDSIQLFSIGISAQSWMTGFLMGKISSGSFATGFGYALMLLAISAGAAVATIEFNISPSAFMGNHPGAGGAGAGQASPPAS
jgi:flagellar protein FlaJ